MTQNCNRFESGEDTVEVYGIDEETGRVECVDAVEGFLFEMPPAELANFLSSHGYTHVATGRQEAA